MDSQIKKGDKDYQPPKQVKAEHKEFMEKVGLKLEKIRKDNKLSISELNRKTGISRNSYSMMERGIIYFSLENFLTALNHFGCTPQDFFKDLQ